MRIRVLLSWLTFPALMGGFVALAAWGVAQGFEPARFAVALTLANFFVILALEQWLPRNPAMSVFRDRQSWNDMGHGVLLATLARPLGGAASLASLALLVVPRRPPRYAADAHPEVGAAPLR